MASADVTARALLIRCAGLVLIASFLLAYDPDGAMAPRVLALLALAAGAWLILRSVLAVALAVALIAAAHSDPSAADVWPGRVFPAIAILAGLTVILDLGRRFKRQINATRDARWASRSGP